MPDAPVVTTRSEKPVYFSSGDETLFGILTEPVVAPRGVAVILIYGGGHNVSAHVGQLWTRMARRVAADGFHALRYDHHGNGDSTGRAEVFDHRTPFVDDLKAAVSYLQEHEGIPAVVFVGDCLGARAALVAAPDLPGVKGLYMMSPMVYDGRMGKEDEWAESYSTGHYIRRALQWRTLKKLTDPRLRRAALRVATSKLKKVTRTASKAFGRSAPAASEAGVEVSSNFLVPLEQVAARRIPINWVFGSTDSERRGEFDAALAGPLARLWENAEGVWEISEVTGRITVHPDLSAQNDLVEDLAGWLQRIDPVS